MEMFWQQIVIVLAVLGAAAYLVRHFVRRSQNKAPCASCPLMKAVENKTPIGRPR